MERMGGSVVCMNHQSTERERLCDYINIATVLAVLLLAIPSMTIYGLLKKNHYMLVPDLMLSSMCFIGYCGSMMFILCDQWLNALVGFQ